MGIITELPIAVIGGRAFEVVEFLGPDEPFLSGTTMSERTKNMSNLADRSDANLFLIGQKFIPGAWHSIIPVFAGTIEHGRFGFLGFSILVWCQYYHRWYKDKRWLGWGFGKDCRLVRRVPALTFEAKHLVFPSL